MISWRLILGVVTVMMMLAACAEKIQPPEERFEEYRTYWLDGNYEAMYELLSEESKQKVTKEEFVQRYTDVYAGVRMNELQVTVHELDEEEEPVTEGERLFSFDLVMSTIAGTIAREQTIQFVLEEREEVSNWYVVWDPGLLFPDLEEGDKVRVTTNSAVRGEIFDRNGTGLAINGSVLEIGIVPERFSEEAMAEVAELLNLTEAEIEEKLNQSWVQVSMFVPIKAVAADETNTVEALMAIDGVLQRNKEARVYPYWEAFAHLIGYIGPITAEELEERRDLGYLSSSVIGKAGLERLYERELMGSNGATIFIENESGERKTVVVETAPVDGQDIHLTVDAAIQQEVYGQLEGDAGTAVAQNPATGEVLALVSSPAYNPNRFILGMAESEWQALQEDPRRPMTNRFTQRFAPGSTIKAVTAAVALENGLDPNAEMEIKGRSWQHDSSWGSYSVVRVNESVESVDLEDALVYSDNIYFARTAVDLGMETMEAGFAAFGFGEAIPFEYPVSESKVANAGISSDVQLADTAYGQGEMEMSLLHLAATYGVFVNGGDMLKPYLRLDTEQEVWKEAVVSEATAASVLARLVQVVESPSGTGHPARIEGRQLAGKTGTTELKLVQGERGEENGWFIALDPTNRDLLVAMMIEEVQDKGGSRYVVPKVRNIFQ